MTKSIVLTFVAATLIAAEPKPEQLAKVRAELKSPQVEVRRAAMMGMSHSELKIELFAELQDGLKDSDGEVRAAAATAIGTMAGKAELVIPALIAQLVKDPTKEARETAARALGRLGKSVPTNRSAVEPLRKAAKDDADPVTRCVALGALALMDEDVPGQVTALRKYLHDDEPLVRMKAAHALGMIGTAAKAAAPEIVMALERETTDAHRRGYIARALGNTGDPNSLAALKKALEKEKDPAAQGEMRGAIQRLQPKP
jgi:HEAT repeat protein